MSELILNLGQRYPKLRRPRRLAGLTVALVAAGGAAVLAHEGAGLIAARLAEAPGLAQAVWLSTVAGAATALGAMAAPLLRAGDESGQRHLLAVSAGVMLAAAVLSLLWPALQALQVRAGWLVAVTAVGALALAGALALHAAGRLLQGGRAADPAERGLWLTVAAIALHNLPEGLAVGAAHAASPDMGLATAVAIGAQNVPEGLVVAIALARLGMAPAASVAAAAASGMLEPLGALAGALTVLGAGWATPAAAALAAGAMLYVVAVELAPRSVAIDAGARRSGAAGLAAMAALALLL